MQHAANVSAWRMRLTRLVLHFKLDEADRLCLLWCSSLRTSPGIEPALEGWLRSAKGAAASRAPPPAFPPRRSPASPHPRFPPGLPPPASASRLPRADGWGERAGRPLPGQGSHSDRWRSLPLLSSRVGSLVRLGGRACSLPRGVLPVAI